MKLTDQSLKNLVNNHEAILTREHKTIPERGLTRLKLGQMYAQIAVVPTDTDSITVAAGGDNKLADALTATVKQSTLHLESDLPFKPEATSNTISMGSNIVRGNISDMTIVNGVVTNMSGSNGNTTIVNGRELDTERGIQVVVYLPRHMKIHVKEVYGDVNIIKPHNNDLIFTPATQCNLQTDDLDGDVEIGISGSSQANIGRVAGGVDVGISGSASINFTSVDGAMNAQISGSASVTIAGGTTSRMRAIVSGSGSIQALGTITNDARLRVSGSGNITARQVDGDLDTTVNGSGMIMANGQSYCRR